MKYKVGDKVKIREDLIVDNDYGSDGFTEEMEQYKGKTATITDVCYDKYEIDIDDGNWCWTDEMLEDDTVVESEDDTRAKNVDIGFYLEYCGQRVIENVCYGGYAHDHNHIFCTTADAKNQYVLPLDSIEFIIPHEVD
jgi:hypothetical protein